MGKDLRVSEGVHVSRAFKWELERMIVLPYIRTRFV